MNENKICYHSNLNAFKSKRKHTTIEFNPEPFWSNSDTSEPMRHYVQTDFLSKYLNKIKGENNSICERNRLKIEKQQQQQKVKSSMLFEFNKEQFASTKYQSAVNYLRNQENHQISV